RRQGVGAVPGPRRPVQQARFAKLPVAAQPLVGGGPRDAHRFRRRRRGPAQLHHSLNQEQSSKRRESRPMLHLSLLSVWLFFTPQTVQRGSSVVNNLRGNYI